MTHSLLKSVSTPFGTFLEALPETTVFVFTDGGRIWKNPTILETDEDVVVFQGPLDTELMGRAVALPCLTPQEALDVAKYHRLQLNWDGRVFCWSQATRRRSAEWCAGFRKKRGSRTHLIPATMEQCAKLIEGALKITYWTNSHRCEIVAA